MIIRAPIILNTNSNRLYNMRKETNKGKILGILLESSKTSAELAHELGYVNSEGSARYNIINKDLKKLVECKYLKSKKVKKEQFGNIPTSYYINFDIQNLRNILIEYPYLISKMQKEELVLEAIFREHSYLICKVDGEFEGQSENIKVIIGIDKEILKKRLQLSTEFFKFVLINDEYKLIYYLKVLAENFNQNISAMYSIRDNLDYETNQYEKTKKWKIAFGLDVAFEACVIKDIMNDQLNQEAIEYVKQMRNKTSNEQIDQQSYCKNTNFTPKPPLSERPNSIKHSENQEIEQELTNELKINPV
jgi:hypothetical protein